MKNPLRLGALLLGLLGSIAAQGAAVQPPEGFTALFNGTDTKGWRGGSTFDHRALLEMPEEERAAKIEKWTSDMLAHWSIADGELVNDGKGAYATTEKDFGDFELLLEYKTVPKADSGVYLRGVPQVQIWDPTEPDEKGLGRALGSGGLWNNSPGAPGKDPLVKADKPFGEWNQLRVVMVGARVSIWLNGMMTVDHAQLENYYDRASKDPEIKANPRPIPRYGPIQLQTHGAEIRWRNIFLREIASEEANRILSAHGEGSDWKKLFNGENLDGWQGPVDEYEVVDGAIKCKPKKGGTLHTVESFANFKVRAEINLPPGGNNGFAIRYPGTGNTAYVGMCELQVLDDSAEKYAKLDPRQYHGSVYGMAAAERGYLRPTGEWNEQQVTVKGSRITVELNGSVILDADVAAVKDFMGGKPHPGMNRTSGSFGFAGHGDPVEFRNVAIKRLD
jgi:hypothetical protein